MSRQSVTGTTPEANMDKPTVVIPPTVAGLMASFMETETGFHGNMLFDGGVLATWQTPDNFDPARSFALTSIRSEVVYRVWVRGGNADASAFYAEVELWDEENPGTEGWSHMTLTPYDHEGRSIIQVTPGWPDFESTPA